MSSNVVVVVTSRLSDVTASAHAALNEESLCDSKLVSFSILRYVSKKNPRFFS